MFNVCINQQIMNEFEKDWSSYTDSKPSQYEVEKLLKQTYDLTDNLKLTTQCTFKTIKLVQMFLTKYFDKNYDSTLICQTSIFVACECEDIVCKPEDIYQHATRIFEISDNKQQPHMRTFKKDLSICSTYMKSKLPISDKSKKNEKGQLVVTELEKDFWDPCKWINETVRMIPDTTLTYGKKYELARIACVLVKGSICLKSICLEYTSDLIAYFSIHLAIQVQKYTFSRKIWLNDNDVFIRVENLMDEYSSVFSKGPRLFQETFGNEGSLYRKVKEITTARAIRLNEALISRAILENPALGHLQPVNNTNQSRISTDSSTASVKKTPYMGNEKDSHAERGRQLEQPDVNLICERVNESTEKKRSGVFSDDNSGIKKLAKYQE